MSNAHTNRSGSSGGRRLNGRRSRNGQAGPRGPSSNGRPAASPSQSPQGAPTNLATLPGPASSPLALPATQSEGGDPAPGRDVSRGKADPAQRGRRDPGRARQGSERPQPPTFAATPAPTQPQPFRHPGPPRADEWRRNGAPPAHAPLTRPSEAPATHEMVRAPRHERPRDELRHGSNGTYSAPPVAAGHDTEGSPNGGPEGLPHRRERAEQQEHAPLRPEARGEVGGLIDALHSVFERDRATASQSNCTRCGICYLHFRHDELLYRESEGFYVCASCSQALGIQQIMMVRRQQR